MGYKYVRLYSHTDTPFLYPHEGLMSNTSQIDCADVAEEFSEVSKAKEWIAILKRKLIGTCSDGFAFSANLNMLVYCRLI